MLRITSTLAGGALLRKATAFRHSNITLRAYSHFRIAQAHAQHGGEGRGEGREDGRAERWWSLFPLTGCVAAVAAAAGAHHEEVQAQAAVVDFLEEETNIGFSRSVQMENAEQFLVGVGMRCMLQRCDFSIARAYAIGLYIDPASAAHVGGGVTDIKNPQLRKTLKLVMARDVKGAHIAKGFDRTLIGKLRDMTGSKQGPAKEALRQFTQAFYRSKLLRTGAEVLFCFSGDGKLQVFIDGTSAVTIESQVLCDAVLDMYTGEKPVGPLIKSKFAAGLLIAASAGVQNVTAPPGTLPA